MKLAHLFFGGVLLFASLSLLIQFPEVHATFDETTAVLSLNMEMMQNATHYTDFSGNGNHAVYDSGGRNYTGIYGKALKSGLQLNCSSLGLTDSFTIMSWIYPSVSSSGVDIYLMRIPASNIYIESYNDKLLFEMSGASLYTTDTITVNTWTHMAFVFNQTNNGWAWYLNGVLNVSGTNSNPNWNGPFVLGRYNYATSSAQWQGKIDEARFFDSALTQAQVQNAMNTAIGTTTSGTEPSTYHLYLDGDDYVESTATFNLTSYSLVAWINHTRDATTDESIILKGDSGSGPGYDEFLEIYRVGDYLRVGHIDTTVNVVSYAYPWTVSQNELIFVVAVFNQTDKFYIYVNGVLGGSGCDAGNISNSPRATNRVWKITREVAAYYQGEVDEVQIWNRVLTSSEVSYLWNNGFGRYEPEDTTNLKLWYKIDEGSGSTLKDKSGNGYEGTLYGGTWRNNTAWASYGRDSPSIVPDWISYDVFWLQTTSPTLTSLSYSSQQLSFTLQSSSGVTSATEVYVGDKGKPFMVNGASSWSYQVSTHIVLITRTHNSPIIILISWGVPASLLANFRIYIYTAVILFSLIPMIVAGFWILSSWHGGEAEFSLGDMVGLIFTIAFILMANIIILLIVNAFIGL